MDVHRAARIAAGYGGQVLLFPDHPRSGLFRTCRRAPACATWASTSLKDIRFPQQIYQLEIEGLSKSFPPIKTLSLAEEPPTPGEAPYKGLQYFDEADAECSSAGGDDRQASQGCPAAAFPGGDRRLGQRQIIRGTSRSGDRSKERKAGGLQVHVFTPPTTR